LTAFKDFKFEQTWVTKNSAASDEGEQAKAQRAQPTEDTLFDKLVRKEIPADIIYEDSLCLAFRDIAPVAKTHFLVIPKNRDGLSQLSKSEARHKKLLGHLMVVASQVAR